MMHNHKSHHGTHKQKETVFHSVRCANTVNMNSPPIVTSETVETQFVWDDNKQLGSFLEL